MSRATPSALPCGGRAPREERVLARFADKPRPELELDRAIETGAALLAGYIAIHAPRLKLGAVPLTAVEASTLATVHRALCDTAHEVRFAAKQLDDDASDAKPVAELHDEILSALDAVRPEIGLPPHGIDFIGARASGRVGRPAVGGGDG